jgi:hypothetical protein
MGLSVPKTQTKGDQMLNLKRIVTLSGVMIGMLSASLINANAATEKARSYEVSLNAATKVGTQVLTAGDYKLKMEGANAVFTKENNNKATFTVPAKLEAGNTKFDYTTINLTQDAGQPRITSIGLKGGNELLKLN